MDGSTEATTFQASPPPPADGDSWQQETDHQQDAENAITNRINLLDNGNNEKFDRTFDEDIVKRSSSPSPSAATEVRSGSEAAALNDSGAEIGGSSESGGSSVPNSTRSTIVKRDGNASKVRGTGSVVEASGDEREDADDGLKRDGKEDVNGIKKMENGEKEEDDGSEQEGRGSENEDEEEKYEDEADKPPVTKFDQTSPLCSKDEEDNDEADGNSEAESGDKADDNSEAENDDEADHECGGNEDGESLAKEEEVNDDNDEEEDEVNREEGAEEESRPESKVRSPAESLVAQDEPENGKLEQDDDEEEDEDDDEESEHPRLEEDEHGQNVNDSEADDESGNQADEESSVAESKTTGQDEEDNDEELSDHDDNESFTGGSHLLSAGEINDDEGSKESEAESENDEGSGDETGTAKKESDVEKSDSGKGEDTEQDEDVHRDESEKQSGTDDKKVSARMEKNNSDDEPEYDEIELREYSSSSIQQFKKSHDHQLDEEPPAALISTSAKTELPKKPKTAPTIRSRRSAKNKNEAADSEKAREEVERKRQEAENAFKGWLSRKRNQQRRARSMTRAQADSKRDTEQERATSQRRQEEAEAAFQGWLNRKKEEHRERRRRLKMSASLSQQGFLGGSNEAFREWRAEKDKQRWMEKRLTNAKIKEFGLSNSLNRQSTSDSGQKRVGVENGTLPKLKNTRRISATKKKKKPPLTSDSLPLINNGIVI